MAFAAGLGVIQRAEAITNLFDLVKFRLVGLMRRIIDHAVGFVVKACGCVWRLRGYRNESKRQNSRRDEELHDSASSSGLRAGARLNIIFAAYHKEQRRRMLPKSVRPFFACHRAAGRTMNSVSLF
jgi:hypothetical protein